MAKVAIGGILLAFGILLAIGSFHSFGSSLSDSIGSLLAILTFILPGTFLLYKGLKEK